jgi:MarR family transcriptional regulator, organic hydroperoxide resistance regulator
MTMTNSPFSVDKAEDSTGFLLWQVTSLWQREIRKALEPFDLTHSQFVLLAGAHWLALSGQKANQILLSTHTKIDPMTTSTVLRTLQKKGLLQRREDGTDTRAKVVLLTEKGQILVVPTLQAMEAFDKRFFSTLGDRGHDFNSALRELLLLSVLA